MSRILRCAARRAVAEIPFVCDGRGASAGGCRGGKIHRLARSGLRRHSSGGLDFALALRRRIVRREQRQTQAKDKQQ